MFSDMGLPECFVRAGINCEVSIIYQTTFYCKSELIYRGGQRTCMYVQEQSPMSLSYASYARNTLDIRSGNSAVTVSSALISINWNYKVTHSEMQYIIYTHLSWIRNWNHRLPKQYPTLTMVKLPECYVPKTKIKYIKYIYIYLLASTFKRLFIPWRFLDQFCYLCRKIHLRNS